MVGILDAVVALHGAAHPVDRGILVGAHVDDVVVAFILHGACGVEGLDGVVGFHKVLARSGLVAQAPYHDGGVVHVSVDHLHVACHVSILKLRHMRE